MLAPERVSRKKRISLPHRACSTRPQAQSPREAGFRNQASASASSALYWKAGKGVAKVSTRDLSTNSSNAQTVALQSAAAAALRDAGVRQAYAASNDGGGTTGIDACVPDLLLFFVAGIGDARTLSRAGAIVRTELKKARMWSDEVIIVGCTSEPIAADGGESDEQDVEVELVASKLPGVRIHPFRIGQPDVPVDLDWRQDDWWERVGCPSYRDDSAEGVDSTGPRDPTDPSGPVFLMFHHPETSAQDALEGLDFAYPYSPKIGSSAGQSRMASASGLFDADGNTHDAGIVGIALENTTAEVGFDIVVAQGVRPVGSRLEIREVRDGSEITKLEETTGQAVSVITAPLVILDMWKQMNVVDERDAPLLGQYLGVEVETADDILRRPTARDPESDTSEDPSIDKNAAASSEADDDVDANGEKLPDVLVRRVVGTNDTTKSLAVDGPPVRVGSGVRFQARDRDSVQQDMQALQNSVADGVVGALLLTDRERVALRASSEDVDEVNSPVRSDRDAFGAAAARLVGSNQVGPLPAPGYRKHFPIRRPGAAASSFQHSSSAVYLLVSDGSLNTDKQ